MTPEEEEEIAILFGEIPDRRHDAASIHNGNVDAGQLATEPVFLNVAFEEKDEAKALGARWNPTEKKWFVPVGKRIADFDRWLPANLRTPEAYIYLIAAPRQCFSCRKIIEVIAFGIPLATEDDEASELEPGELRWHDPEKFDWLTVVPRLDVFPTEIRELAERRYGFRPAESKTTGLYQLNNVCPHCGALQGEFFLHSERGPFLVSGREELAEHRFYKIPVPAVCGEPHCWSSAGRMWFDVARDRCELLDLHVIEPIVFFEAY